MNRYQTIRSDNHAIQRDLITAMGFYKSGQAFTAHEAGKCLGCNTDTANKVLGRMVVENLLTRFRPKSNMSYRYWRAPENPLQRVWNEHPNSTRLGHHFPEAGA